MWKLIAEQYADGEDWFIQYDEEKGMYQVSRWVDGEERDCIIFDEVEK